MTGQLQALRRRIKIKVMKNKNAKSLVDGLALINWYAVTFDSTPFSEETVQPFEAMGKLNVRKDGSFLWERTSKKKSESKLIKKTNHGRLSETKDGYILLTIKMSPDEMLNMPGTLIKECREAAGELELYIQRGL